MTDPDPAEQARIEQRVALMTEAEFASLIARTRLPSIADPDLRDVVRRLLGNPDPDPEPGPNIVPAEGRIPRTVPPITTEQYARDFLRRVTGQIPAHAEHLPEPENGQQ